MSVGLRLGVMRIRNVVVMQTLEMAERFRGTGMLHDGEKVEIHSVGCPQIVRSRDADYPPGVDLVDVYVCGDDKDRDHCAFSHEFESAADAADFVRRLRECVDEMGMTLGMECGVVEVEFDGWKSEKQEASK